MNVYKGICQLFLLFISTSLLAGVSDLALEISPDRFADLVNNDTGFFELVLTNNGPDDAGVGSPVSFPISINSEILFDNGTFNIGFSKNNDMPQKCIFIPTVIDPRPGDPPGIVYSFFIEAIPAGESVSCFASFQIFDDLFASSIEWRVVNPSDDDPEDSNNRENMNFFGTVVSVPTISFLNIVLLMFLMLTAIYFTIKTKML